ncbi:recombinase family protein [Bradyrhizobium sp. JR3.5]
MQRDALLAAGVDPRHLFEDHASGAKDDRTGLARALELVRPGDVLVVWKLDRLGRSLSHRLVIVASLKDNRVGVPLVDRKPGHHDALGRIPVPGAVRRARAV